MTLAKACEILQLDERRIQRWIKLAEEGCYTRQSACDAKPHVPYNALTPEQKAVLEQYLAAKEYADASCRELSIRTLEQEGIYISHVSYWEAMKAKGINGPRGIQAKRLTARTKPETTWAKKPNQLWAWDITYLLTNERLKFFYLYAIIDRVSRKVVAWIRVVDKTTQQVLYSKGFSVPTCDAAIYASDGASSPNYLPVGTVWSVGFLLYLAQRSPLITSG
jgi:putative transposase